MAQWIAACDTDDVDPEDVIPFDHAGNAYAVYRSPDDAYYATDGHCTHEQQLLCDGLVMDGVIECPKHNGRFDYTTGKALGAAECGTRAAFALRENGWTGPITLVGGEAELPYERPPLSKTWTHKLICDDERLRAAAVTYLPGTHATALDPHGHAVALDDGRTLAYAKLLLATGATARSLPFDGAPVHLVRTHADARALRARLRAGTRIGVIGGGFIGLELAAAAAGFGAEVTVLELADRLMGRAVPARIAH